MIEKIQKNHLTIQTFALSSLGAELRCTRQTWHYRPMNISDVPCCSHGEFHCVARDLRRTQSSECWEHVTLGHLMLRGGVQILQCAVGPLSDSVAVSTPPCSSTYSIQTPSIHEVTQKTLEYPNWTNGASWLRTYLYKFEPNHISNHLAMWFEFDLQKSDFMWFTAVQTSWNQPGYSQNLIWAGSLNEALLFWPSAGRAATISGTFNHFSHFSKKKSKKNCWLSVLNVRICCFSASFTIVNEESLYLGQLFGQKTQFEDVTFAPRNWDEHF